MATSTQAQKLRKLADAGDLQGAESVMRGLMAMPYGMANCRMFGNVLRACSKAANGHAAEYWFGEMVQRGMSPDRRSYLAVVLAWAKAGDLARCEAWIRRLLAAGLEPPKGLCRQIVRKYIGCTPTNMLLHDAEMVTEWLARVDGLGVRVDRTSINHLIGELARGGDLAGTEKLAKLMAKVGTSPNISTIGALAEASQHGGRSVIPDDLREHAEELGLLPPGLAGDALAFGDVQLASPLAPPTGAGDPTFLDGHGLVPTPSTSSSSSAPMKVCVESLGVSLSDSSDSSFGPLMSFY